MTLPVCEIVRFGVVGMAATMLHYLVLSAGVEFADASPVVMTGIAFLCAVGVTYVGQSIWVFRVRRHGAPRVVRFGISVLAGLVGNVAIMGATVNLLQLDYTIGFIAGLILVPAATYLLNKKWVFAE